MGDKSVKLDTVLAKRFAQQQEKLLAGEDAMGTIGSLADTGSNKPEFEELAKRFAQQRGTLEVEAEKLEKEASPVAAEEHVSVVEIRWMWADAGSCAVPLSARLAKRNPLRWSSLQTLEQTIADLQSWKRKDCVRPIRLEIFRDAQGGPRIESESVEAALAELSSQRVQH